MKFVKAESVSRYNFDVEPIQVKNRKNSVVQIDTDSCYCCFQEFKEEICPDMDGFVWFDALDAQLDMMWKKVLQIRADKKKIPQLIKFCRENMFKGFFSFAKKLYIGSIVDSEGIRFSFEQPEPKIKGVSLQKDEMPFFCKKEAIPLAFDIMHGISKQDAISRIVDIYEEFKKQPVDEISSKRSVTDYTKYVDQPIEYFIENGLSKFKKGMPANVKMALAYNYTCAKNMMVLEPIESNSKFNYIHILPTNKYGFDSIAYIGSWPKEFAQMFEVDYEESFRKFCLSVFQSMFEILGWGSKKSPIPLTKVKKSKFIK